MATDSSSASGGSGIGRHLPDPVVGVLLAIRGSLMNFIAAIGVVMVLLGAFGPALPVIGSYMQGEMAGLLGIWGVSSVAYAVIAHAFMSAIGYT